jgi:putative ABC transport system permease protein
MIPRIAFSIARRELRGGLRNFRIFLACLALGIAAIAAVGSVRASIEQGLAREGAVILGGDAQMGFTYRFASPDEKVWMQDNAIAVSEVAEFRSMVVVVDADGETRRGLSQIKSVDAAYPLLGSLELEPAMSPAAAFAAKDGVPGAILHPLLIDRMGLEIGDTFRLGTNTFRLSASLIREPDAAAQGFGLGPRSIVLTRDLEGSGLLGPGSLFNTHYRLKLGSAADLNALEAEAEALFRNKGLNWRDSRNGAPGVEVFVNRIASFLVLVGLAGLAVGGIGVSSAVRTYLETKTEVIATLKTLGAGASVIFWAYFLQIGALAALGIFLGLALGALLPILAAPLISAALPLPVAITIHAAPLIEAATYGVLTALLFTIWPIARARDIRPAALFRDSMTGQNRLPRARFILLTLLILGLLVASALYFAAMPFLAVWTFGGILVALLVLLVAGFLVRFLAAKLAKSRALRGKTALRLAFGAIGGPKSEAMPVILSLGLGLSVLAAIGQIDANLRGAIERELPDVAPAFFFVDIQRDQLEGFRARTTGNAGVSRVDTAPMLRGLITKINGRPAREVAGDHWVIAGDRGITYADKLPDGTVITAGEWWPEGYAGPPQISFAEEEALELGLKIGDEITVNILGRDITAKITSFRVVDFSNAGIGFVLTMNPAAVAAAPHTFIATVYSDLASEAAILREIGDAYPNITAIRVRDAIERVANALGGMAAATSYGALATLLTGFVVLIGAAAAGERAREYEAAILKTLGATRQRILLSFALRAGILGLAAGGVAIGAGALAGWGIMRFVMEATYRFEPISAISIVVGGALVTLLAGLFFALRPLAATPAGILRSRE